MIKNEETYCTVQHKIVRELGACEAVVYGTIQWLLRKTDGYGGVSNQTIMDMCRMNRKSLSRYIDKLIQSGYIEKVSGDGRGNISIYYISKKGDKMTTFNEEKGGQNDPKRGTNLPIKGDKMTPINKDINNKNILLTNRSFCVIIKLLLVFYPLSYYELQGIRPLYIKISTPHPERYGLFADRSTNAGLAQTEARLVKTPPPFE